MRAIAVALAIGTLTACAQVPSEPARDGDARARQLAERSLVVDTHIDLPYRLHKADEAGTDTPPGDFDHSRALAGGLDAAFMSIYVPAEVDEAGDARAFAEAAIDRVEGLAGAHTDAYTVATCTTDVLHAQAEGLVALPMGMENGGPLAGSLDALDHFRERGIRYITLAHSRSNHISDSSYDDNERWGGLSPFGRRLIPAMNERGVLVDVSHLSDDAFWQVLELSETPVLATHSSLRHFTPGFERNMSDAMVRALGENGGVIQINYGSAFLTEEAQRWGDALDEAREAYRAEHGLDEDDPRLDDFAERYRERNPYPYADLEDVLDHIDRAVGLAGIDHVGIGSDYDGVGDTLPTGLKDASSYPALVAGLLQRGYEEGDIAKILGGNTMRVWRHAEAYAARAGYPPLCRR